MTWIGNFGRQLHGNFSELIINCSEKIKHIILNALCVVEKWTQKMLGKVVSSDSFSRKGVGEENS